MQEDGKVLLAPGHGEERVVWVVADGRGHVEQLVDDMAGLYQSMTHQPRSRNRRRRRGT